LGETLGQCAAQNSSGADDDGGFVLQTKELLGFHRSDFDAKMPRAEGNISRLRAPTIYKMDSRNYRAATCSTCCGPGRPSLRLVLSNALNEVIRGLVGTDSARTRAFPRPGEMAFLAIEMLFHQADLGGNAESKISQNRMSSKLWV